ncbi:MAG TPA: metal-dependent hydrolase [Gammaproteobacteria bacterium]
MEPIAHTFTGAALAATGLRRATPLATAALVIGANAPDVDVICNLGGIYAALALRRGWTHGVLALALWPFVITGALLLFDRLRRRRDPQRPRPRAGPLLGLATLAVLTHPTLDWLNNYGLRWLMPFDDRWFYGDALFIVDPWLWLGLGGVLWLRPARSRGATYAWAVFWMLATALVLLTPEVPALSRIVWLVGLAALGAARALPTFAPLREPPRLERAARVAVVAAAAYIAATVGASAAARREVRAELAARGIGPVESVMVAPVPANPLAGTVIAATSDRYWLGDWHWLARPRFEPSQETIERLPVDDVIRAAIDTVEARRFLVWSRYPYYEKEPLDGGGYVVSILDARYRGTGRLTGPRVRVDPDLRAKPLRQ